MAGVRKRTRDHNGKEVVAWTADFHDQNGVIHRKYFQTQREAKAYFAEQSVAVQARTFRTAAGKMRVSQVAEEWLEELAKQVGRDDMAADTFSGYSSIKRLFITAEQDFNHPKHPNLRGTRFGFPVGNTLLREVDSEDGIILEGHVRDLGFSRSRSRHARIIYGMIMDFAKRKKYIATNPLRGMRRKNSQEDKPEIQVPEKANIKALLASVDGPDRLLIQFAVCTGVRSSEQRAVFWSDIDLSERTVCITKKVVKGKFKKTKTKAGRRTIPLSRSLVKRLTEHRAKLNDVRNDDLVFPTREGTPREHGGILRDIYNPAWKRTIADWKGRGPIVRCNWHALRHFAISCWIEQNVALKQITTWAGHSSVTITLDIYGHLFKSTDKTGVMDRVAGELDI